MGDSLTRYQYLNFIGFLHTGQWASRKPSLESAKGWDGFAVKFSWDLSMKISNLRFGGYEICDCYRDEKHTIEIPLSEAQRYHNNVLGMKENRHYFDPIQNISVKYFWWTGYPFLMSAIPKITDFEDIDFNFRDQLLHNFSATYEHRYDTVESFLMEQIKPRNPDILIINMGMWQDSPALKALNENPKNFADAMKAAAKVPIWKTTTPLVKSSKSLDVEATMIALKNESLIFLDAYEILKPFSVGDEVYEDPCHFKPPMYALVNKHMLLLFEEIL